MGSSLVIILALALAVALWRLGVQRRFIKHLSQAVANDQALLRSREAGLYRNSFWNRFRLQVNTLIDELKHVRSERATQVGQLQATLESIREAVLILDADNRIVLANDALRELFPASDTIKGQRVEAVFPSSEFLSYIAEARREGGAAQREIEFRMPGKVIWTEATCSLIPDFKEDDPGSMLFVLHDITRLKQLESMRKDFVANVSHELRTPLSMIKGYVETLVDGGTGVKERDREKFLLTIQKHADRLHALLEDLLTLSRLERGREQVPETPLDLASLIRETAANYHDAGLLNPEQLRLHIPEEEIHVLGDTARLNQVFENLIDNAIKYSGNELLIEIGARIENGHVTAWVRDHGVGIAAQDLPRIFERFYRVDKGRSREKGGTGLGLSIVKHIVQLHGGHVWAESRLDEGATFFFTLPLRQAAYGGTLQRERK